MTDDLQHKEPTGDPVDSKLSQNSVSRSVARTRVETKAPVLRAILDRTELSNDTKDSLEGVYAVLNGIHQRVYGS